MRKHIISDKNINETFKPYLERFCKVVTSTMGPYGNTVMIENGNAMPVVTKDGVTVAKKLQSTDKVENMVFSILKQASLETLKAAGDGTTSTAAIILGLSEAYDVNNDRNPNNTKRELYKDVEYLIDKLKDMAIETTPEILESVIRTSSNNDEEIVSVMKKAFRETANVVVFDRPTDSTGVEIIDGYEIETKLLDPNIVSNKNEEQYILITNDLNRAADLSGIINRLKVFATNSKEVLWIHSHMDKRLFSQVMRETKNVYPITIEGIGGMISDYLHDIAVYTDSKVYTPYDDIDFTRCKFEIGNSIIIKTLSYNKDRVNERIKKIKNALSNVESEYVKNQYRKRMAKLQGKLAIIHFQGRTESAFMELLDRVDDAIRAVQSAIEKGVVYGGATTYARLSVLAKTDLLRKALRKPLNILLESAGLNVSYIVTNASTDEESVIIPKGEMIDLDTGNYTNTIYDPALVIESAIKNAVSAFTSLMTTKFALEYINDKDS